MLEVTQETYLEAAGHGACIVADTAQGSASIHDSFVLAEAMLQGPAPHEPEPRLASTKSFCIVIGISGRKHVSPSFLYL
jgi:hypothetical protein